MRKCYPVFGMMKRLVGWILFAGLPLTLSAAPYSWSVDYSKFTFPAAFDLQSPVHGGTISLSWAPHPAIRLQPVIGGGIIEGSAAPFVGVDVFMTTYCQKGCFVLKSDSGLGDALGAVFKVILHILVEIDFVRFYFGLTVASIAPPQEKAIFGGGPKVGIKTFEFYGSRIYTDIALYLLNSRRSSPAPAHWRVGLQHRWG